MKRRMPNWRNFKSAKNTLLSAIERLEALEIERSTLREKLTSTGGTKSFVDSSLLTAGDSVVYAEKE